MKKYAWAILPVLLGCLFVPLSFAVATVYRAIYPEAFAGIAFAGTGAVAFSMLISGIVLVVAAALLSPQRRLAAIGLTTAVILGSFFLLGEL